MLGDCGSSNPPVATGRRHFLETKTARQLPPPGVPSFEYSPCIRSYADQFSCETPSEPPTILWWWLVERGPADSNSQDSDRAESSSPKASTGTLPSRPRAIRYCRDPYTAAASLYLWPCLWQLCRSVSVSAVCVTRREHENEAGVMCARCEVFAWCDRLRVGVL